MKEEVDKIISEKISECGGNIDKLQESLSNYFGVPPEDIHTNIKMTIPVPESMIKKEPEPINVNLSIKVKDENKDEYLETNEEARQEGIYEGKLEVARSLLDNGMSFDEILRITDLTEDDLDNL